MKILVNIPAYNEEKTIATVIKAIHASVRNHEVMVQVVDDGSSDDTVQVATGAGAKNVISHVYNQ